MSKSKMLLATMMLAVLPLVSLGQTATPLEAVNSFYKFDRANSQTFNRTNIEARRHWFSSELYSLFQKELKREAAYLKKNPSDKPYFGDGLPFQPLDETCKAGRRTVHKALSTSHGTQSDKKATILASFAFPKPCKDPDNTVYTIALVRTKAGWVIDDVLYENDRSLKADLNRKEY